MQKSILLGIICLYQLASIWAAPTSLFWTICTTETLDTGVVSAQATNYFPLKKGDGPYFSPQVGCNFGLFTWNNFSGEAGLDYIKGHPNAVIFNGKIGCPEGKLFTNAPSLSVGIYNAGPKPNKTNVFNIVDCIVGKSLPKCLGGELFAGVYRGGKTLGKHNAGIMVGYDRGFYAAKAEDGSDYYKLYLTADYASGKNVIGGYGVSATYYFTPLCNLQTGPIRFNAPKINGRWKWSLSFTYGVKVR
jgi:hypothetical protein